MPLKIISDEELEKELNNCSVRIEQKKVPGRDKGDNNVPESLRKIIGETGATEGRQEALALSSEFGISPSSTSAYTVGATSTASYDKPQDDLLAYVNSRKLGVAKKAQSKLIKALNHITEDKLAMAKPADLATVARAMSHIVKDMEPEQGVDSNKGPTFVFYAPRVFNEDKFPTVVVNE